jgi:D-alanyl-D-alanine dipeptidase
MLNVILGHRPSGEPRDDPAVLNVEGWILGQLAEPTGATPGNEAIAPAVVSRRYRLGNEFPAEGFVQQALEQYFRTLGFQLDLQTHADLFARHPNSGERWVVEAKGRTSDIGLDLRTGLGQLLRREIGPDGDLQSAYRRWSEEQMEEHDRMMLHMMEEFHRRYRPQPVPQTVREPIRALNRVPLFECREPLVDIRRYCPGVRVARRCLPFLRARVAEMLNAAQAALPAGYRFQVTTALRTLAMQQELYDRYFARLQEEHPGWSYATLRRCTNRFFAPADQKAPPGHCTGGAVDVRLLGPGGRRLDLTSPYEGWAAAPTCLPRLSPRAARNREILVAAMLGAGFSNCQEEYWHYSYGDAAWAVRTGQPNCIYGLVQPPRRSGRRAGESLMSPTTAREDEPGPAEPSQPDAAWSRLRDHLESERQRIQREIGRYPRPVTACDAQFNYLLEQRSLLGQETLRLEKALTDPAAGSVPMRALHEFIETSACLDEEAKRRLRDP